MWRQKSKRPLPPCPFAHPRAPAPEQWLTGDDEARGWVEALLERAHGTEDPRGPNVLAFAAWAVDTGLAPKRDSAGGDDKSERYQSAASAVVPRRPRFARVLDAEGKAIEWPQEAEEDVEVEVLVEVEEEPPPAPALLAAAVLRGPTPVRSMCSRIPCA